VKRGEENREEKRSEEGRGRCGEEVNGMIAVKRAAGGSKGGGAGGYGGA